MNRLLLVAALILLFAAPASAQNLHFVYTELPSGDHKPAAFYPTQATADAAAAGDAALHAHPGAVAVSPGFDISTTVWDVASASWRSFGEEDMTAVRRLRLLAKRFVLYMQGVGAATVESDWAFVALRNYARVVLSSAISNANRIAFAEQSLLGPAGVAPSAGQFLIHVSAQASAPTLDGFWVNVFSTPIQAEALDGDMYDNLTPAQEAALADPLSAAELVAGQWRNDIPPES